MPSSGHGERQLLLCSLTEAPLTETLDKYNELCEPAQTIREKNILSVAFSHDAIRHANGWVNFQGAFICSS